MKHFIYVILAFVLISSCTKEEAFVQDLTVGQPTKSDEKENQRDTMWCFSGFYDYAHILFTDKNNVSVFDKSGYNWNVDDIKQSYLIDGKEVPLIENAEPYIVDYSDIRYFPNYIRNDFFNPKWVYIFNDSTQNGIEFVIRILKFPDQSVDTMTWQVKSYYTDGRYGTIANYYASFSVLKIWYNSEVRFDFKNHALNPDVFPDGRKKVYHDFQVIK